jgi:putative phosphonate metabolism protein
MTIFKRYAVYYAPKGDWAQWATAWLGWDAEAGQTLPQPLISGLPATLADLTATPRKYGLHGTLKPPFRLASGVDADDLVSAVANLAATQTPFSLEGLKLAKMGGFLALIPTGDTSALTALAAKTVTVLDPLRAPLSDAELAKRRQRRLSPQQEQYLIDWGYPYVLDEFRFHITLTGNFPAEIARQTEVVLAKHLAPLLPAPFVIDDLGLYGEDAEGRFHLVHRIALSG